MCYRVLTIRYIDVHIYVVGYFVRYYLRYNI